MPELPAATTKEVPQHCRTGLTNPFHVQIAGPSIYRAYVDGAKRLGHDDDAAGHRDLHIGEDLRHGKQMIEDVVVPLVDKEGAFHLSLKT